MPKFLAVHTLPSLVTIEQAFSRGKKAKATNPNVNAYWVSSWCQLNKERKVVKILCEWNAVNEESIRKELAKVPELPVDGIYPMMKVDSEDYR